MRSYNLKVQNKIQYRTVPEMVTDLLRESILKGELKEGEQLKQEDLASLLNVSLSPIREALKSLEAEGLVKFYPNKGAIVTKLSSDEAQEIFEIRFFLESGALALSIPNLTKTDLVKAEKILNEADCEELSDKWSELNWQFHETLYQRARKPRLLNLIHVMHNNVERYMRLYLAAMNYQKRSQVEHRELLIACAQGDIKIAQDILGNHMEDASKSLTRYLKQVDDRP